MIMPLNVQVYLSDGETKEKAWENLLELIVGIQVSGGKVVILGYILRSYEKSQCFSYH